MEATTFLDNLSPIQKFTEWFEEAKKTTLKDPNAMVLSTADTEGQPHSRIVLLKDVRPDGFVIYTNYQSNKGRQIAANPNVAFNFFWDPLFRQVKWRGKAEKLTRAESEAYWKTRPRQSQLGQWVSQQSQPVSTREAMEQELIAAEEKWQNQDVPCPPHWGGYLLAPTYVEFWIGREGRFHDRYTYKKVENTWFGQRLYP